MLSIRGEQRMMSHSQSTTDESGELLVPPDSPGSSVSSRMQEEYDELLKYAVIVPNYDAQTLPHTISDLRGSFPKPTLTQQTDINMMEPDQQSEVSAGEADDESTTVVDEEEYDHDQADGQDVADTRGYHIHVERGHARFADTGSTQASSGQQKPVTTGRDDFLLTQKMDLQTALMSTNGTHDDRRSESPAPSMDQWDGEYTDQSDFSPGVDRDVTRMDMLLDQWCGDLKRNVLAEYSQSKIRVLQQTKLQMQKERERHAAEMSQLQNELESMKELLHTYELSIERKDEVMSNMVQNLQKQREKYDMLKTFCDWKIKHNDAKREAFASQLAYNHYQRSLKLRCWDAWHSIVENKWRHRVEKACQAKAQEVCMDLTNDYETKIASLNEALEASRLEVSRLHAEREKYEETMKKAFMRGVCALNLEAMTMFHEPEENGRPEDEEGHAGTMPKSMVPGRTEMPDGYSATIPQEPVYSCESPGAPGPRIVTSQAATRPSTVSHTATSQAGRSKSQGGMVGSGGKVIKARLTARQDTNKPLPRGSAPLGLAPPMSSVMVERHQPVTKQTVGHATASKYPRPTDGQNLGPQQSSIVQRKIAGQPGQASPNIQTVKVVQ